MVKKNNGYDNMGNLTHQEKSIMEYLVLSAMTPKGISLVRSEYRGKPCAIVCAIREEGTGTRFSPLALLLNEDIINDVKPMGNIESIPSTPEIG